MSCHSHFPDSVLVMSSDFHLGNAGLIPPGSFHLFLNNKRHLSGKFKIVSQPEPGPTKLTQSWYDSFTLVSFLWFYFNFDNVLINAYRILVNETPESFLFNTISENLKKILNGRMKGNLQSLFDFNYHCRTLQIFTYIAAIVSHWTLDS